MAVAEARDVRIRASSLRVSCMLAVAGGFLDGFTYIGHGRVFANAMTANVILMGASLFLGSWRTALEYLLPLIAFVMAVWTSQGLQLHSTRRKANPPYGPVLLLEVAALLVLSLLPETTPHMLFTTSIAFAATVQMATFREVHGRAYSSTFTTGNLRTLSEAAFTRFVEGPSPATARLLKDFSVIVSGFLLGAVAGGAATKRFGNHALWLDIGLLTFVWSGLQVRFVPPWARPSANWQ